MKKIFETPAIEIFHLAVADTLTSDMSGELIEIDTTYGLKAFTRVGEWNFD